MKKINFETVRQAEKVAEKNIKKETFQWLQAAAEDGFTHQKNIEDLNKIKIIPLQLSLNGKPKLESNFFGKKISSPLILSPMGHQTQFFKSGEIDMAKGTHLSNTVGFFSTQGRIKLETIRKKNRNSILAWEIFPFGDFKWVRKQIESAEKNKCVAIAICIDANVRSHRYLDREIKYDARKYCMRNNPVSPDPKKALTHNWNLIKLIKKQSKLPIIVKGVLSKEDAIKSIKYGADALWISNHGGRQLDGSRAPFDQLAEIADAVGGKIEIILDGGIRRGTHVLKALALGANACCFGKAYLYALSAGGQKAVEILLENMKSEIERDMTLMGCKSIKELDRSKIAFRKD